MNSNSITSKISQVVFYRLGRFFYFLCGFSIMLLLWYLLSLTTKGEMPGPFQTMNVFLDLVLHPFYDHGPNEKGIGNQLVSSLIRVSQGFLMGSLIAIPL